jgi:hypothetical protein
MQTFMAWQAMAGRDGAMQLYHTETVMRLIGKLLKAAPTLRAGVDHKLRREAIRIFAKAFPHAKNIRDAVGHSFAELSLHDGFVRHVATKVDLSPDVVANNAQIVISNSLIGQSGFAVTIKGKVHTYELNGTSLARLREPHKAFVTSFLHAAPPMPEWSGQQQ